MVGHSSPADAVIGSVCHKPSALLSDLSFEFMNLWAGAINACFARMWRPRRALPVCIVYMIDSDERKTCLQPGGERSQRDTVLRLHLVAGGGSSSAEPPFSSPVEIFLDPVLVSYSYFEKDDIQRTNFEFFMAVRRTTSPCFINSFMKKLRLEMCSTNTNNTPQHTYHCTMPRCIRTCCN